jgi:hypothetical protein
MKKIEKEILNILNPSAKEIYDHKFTSLTDTCSDPNPPYTVRITPLYHFFTNYSQIKYDSSMYSDDEEKVEILNKEQMDYLIKNSPLHYMYRAEGASMDEAATYFNPLMIAIDNYERITLTDEQYKYLIQNSDLLVGKNKGNPALVFALYRNHAGIFDLNEENWELLKTSARELDNAYIDKWEKEYNLKDDYFIMYPQLASKLKDIIREQHIIANKEELESTLDSHEVRSKKSKL